MATPEVLSTNLQYVALFFEFTGLSLAFIEVQFPSSAKRLSEWVISETSETDDALKLLASRVDFGNPKLGTIIYLKLSLVAFLGMAWLSVSTFFREEYLFFITSFLGLLLATSWFAFKWIPKRPLGSFGIIWASFGVMCEVVQMSISSGGA
jgi:hypothetical protein